MSGLVSGGGVNTGVATVTFPIDVPGSFGVTELADITLGVGNSFAAAVNQNAAQLQLTGTITEFAGASTHAVIAQLLIPTPTITNDATAVTTQAASIYVQGAPTGITPTGGGPFSILVDAGPSRFDGEISALGGIRMDDNDKVKFGTADDIEMYWDGTRGHIDCRAAGGLTGINMPGTLAVGSAGTNSSDSIGLVVDHDTDLGTNRSQIQVRGHMTMTNAAQNVFGIDCQPQVTKAGTGESPIMASAYFKAPVTTVTGGTIANASTIYVADAPTDGTKNYAIFSVSGANRFGGEVEMDGDLNHDGTNVGFFGTAPTTQQATIVDADGTLADITTKFNTLLADLEGYGLLASA